MGTTKKKKSDELSHDEIQEMHHESLEEAHKASNKKNKTDYIYVRTIEEFQEHNTLNR